MECKIIGELLKTRYKKPLEALTENAFGKGLLSLGAFIITSFTGIINTVGDIFNTPAELVILLIFAIIADLVTGVMAARRKGNYLRSIAFRQTWVKIIEYGLGLMILAGLANVMGTNGLNGWVGESLSYLKNIHWLGYVYCIFHEFKSAFIENLGAGDSAIGKIVEKIDQRYFNKDKNDLE